MDTKLLLVKTITLLYRESQLSTKTENSAELANAILGHIRLPDAAVASDFGRDPAINLRETVRWMLTKGVEYTYDKSELLQRLRVNVGNDDALYDALVAGISPDFDEDALKRMCHGYRDSLRVFMAKKKVQEKIKQAHHQVAFNPDAVDWRHFVNDLRMELEPYQDMEQIDTTHPSVVSDVIFSDAETVKGAFVRGIDELDSRGILRFGWHGLNRMFGSNGGGRRGEMMVIGALPHQFKSGTTMEMFKSAALYNTPYLRDPTRKPMLMRISFENTIELDILNLYKSLAENETGIPLDIANIDIDQATQYVIERLQVNGYHISMAHINPSDYTFHDLFQRIERFESEGYEIHMLNLDYLAMMSKRGCATGPAGVEIRDLYRRVRNFIIARGIFCVTPHQLSPDAKRMVRMGVENFVQEIASKGYYDGCTTIDQEVDIELIQHIVQMNGEAFLTFQRGKHRKVGITPERDKYFVYKFQGVGSIPDDVLGVDMSRRSVGGKTMAEGGEAAWWQGV